MMEEGMGGGSQVAPGFSEAGAWLDAGERRWRECGFYPGVVDPRGYLKPECGRKHCSRSR